MSTNKYMPRNSRGKPSAETSGLARPVHPARPELDPKPGASNKTPAPLAVPRTTPDMARATSWGRSSGDPAGGNPGANGYGGPSSLNPGERAGDATVHAAAPIDTTLDALVRGGVRALDQGADDWQTRRLDDPADRNRKASPIHPAMQPANSGGAPAGTVPAKLGMPVTAPVRQPPADPSPYPKKGIK